MPRPDIPNTGAIRWTTFSQWARRPLHERRSEVRGPGPVRPDRNRGATPRRRRRGGRPAPRGQLRDFRRDGRDAGRPDFPATPVRRAGRQQGDSGRRQLRHRKIASDVGDFRHRRTRRTGVGDREPEGRGGGARDRRPVQGRSRRDRRDHDGAARHRGRRARGASGPARSRLRLPRHRRGPSAASAPSRR